jgi:hypothetical protein
MKLVGWLRIAVTEAWGQFDNPEEGYVRRWKPEAATKQRLVKSLESV